jgi:hypothetical protein
VAGGGIRKPEVASTKAEVASRKVEVAGGGIRNTRGGTEVRKDFIAGLN